MLGFDGFPQDSHVILQFIFVGLLGGLSGFAELISRYRDNPWRLLHLWATWLYIFGNIIVAVAAMTVAVIVHWDFGQNSPGGIQAARIIACGFGSMLLLRSALVSIRVDGRDVSIGPAGIVGALLDGVDRIIDRNQARYRSIDAKNAMQGISFDKAQNILPQYTFRLMESASAADIKAVLDEIKTLQEGPISEQERPVTDQAKAYMLGVILIRMAGQEVLADAVRTLREELRPGLDGEVDGGNSRTEDEVQGIRELLLDSELADPDGLDDGEIEGL